MAGDIESREFREHARRNGFQYGSLFIYKKMDMALLDFGMPEYRSKADTGAIESFVGLLQNISEALDNDPKAKMAKNLPGVDTPPGNFSKTLSVSGPMYFKDYKDCRDTMRAVNLMVHKYGWQTIHSSVAVTYKPNPAASGSGDLYGEDPVTAASRAMMLSSMSHVATAAKVLAGTGSDSEYAHNIAKLETQGLGNTFTQAKEAFLTNTGAVICGKWQHAGYPVKAVVEGSEVVSSVNLVPTSLTITPAAYVRDSSTAELYPTRIDVSLTLQNPYGLLFPTNNPVEA